MKFNQIKKASIFGIIGNLFLLIRKLIVGFASNSIAMISDAFNSGADVFSSIMTFIGNKIASKPADHDHNLGHGKAEYIYSMLISIAMTLTGIVVLKDALFSIIYKNKVDYSIYLIVVCLTTIFIKLMLYLYTKILSKKYNNLLIKANSNDHRNDCFITLLTLISCIFSRYNIYFIDGIVGIIISIWILISSIKIFVQSYDVLMDKTMSIEKKDMVYEIINKYNDVKKVNHFNATPVGYQYQISFTIFVDGKMTTSKSHEIADALEKEITSSIDEIYLTIIHVNPID